MLDDVHRGIVIFLAFCANKDNEIDGTQSARDGSA